MIFTNKNILLVTTLTIFITGCSEPAQDKRLVGVGSNKDNESVLAASLYCAGAAQVLSEVSVETYPTLMQWRETFTEIEGKATQQAESLIGQDGAAIEKRLSVIKEQTQANVKRFDANNDEQKLMEFTQATMAKCKQFALDS